MESATGTRQKALALNLGARADGSFAEVGAGQEVARWFFSAGGAAGTVAKTTSAYDMAVSDALYGPTPRHVSRQRLGAMLEHEFARSREGPEPGRGDAKCFFAFADTAATGGYRKPGPGRGWLGVRFQARPHEEPSEVIAHWRAWGPNSRAGACPYSRRSGRIASLYSFSSLVGYRRPGGSASRRGPGRRPAPR